MTAATATAGSATPTAIGETGETGAAETGARRPWPRPASHSLAAALYLALGVGLWWHVWSTSPSTTMTCDCTDAGRMVWYLEWIPYALGHGHALLHSTYQFHPQGFNLLADTSVPALGLVSSPVTELFGPVVSINVLSTLIPAATAFSMYWLLRRWVQWAPAAFVGGLAYGFSAWVVVQLSFGWINLACLAVLPLMAAALDELLVGRRLRAVSTGVLLGLLVTVEFFVSTEMALLSVIGIGLATLFVAAGAALVAREQLRRRWRRAGVGLGTAAAVAVVLLAYPVWFFADGPGHLGGSVWTTNVPGSLGNTVGNLWDPIGHWGSLSSRFLVDLARVNGGFRGAPGPAASFLGWGFLVVLTAGLVVWRRDRRLWLLAAVGATTFVLSLQDGPHHWAPWSLFDHLPVLLNVVQYRFAGVFLLCAAAILGTVIDQAHTEVLRRAARPGAGGDDRAASAPAPPGLGGRLLAGLAAALLAVVALGNTAQALSPNLPVPVQPVTVPSWFTTEAPRLPPGTVLATYPFPTADSQAAIPWQAIPGMPYQMAGGGGPAGTVPRAGREQPGFRVLLEASVPSLPAPRLGPRQRAAVVSALRAWGVTTVVVPDDRGLKRFQTGRGAAYGVAFFTRVLGRGPRRQPGAWVWTVVPDRSGPRPS